MFVAFFGNLTADAKKVELVNSDGVKQAFLSFTVAETTFARGTKGTEFVDCTTSQFKIAQFLTKGKRVFVCGAAVIERSESRDGKLFARLKVRVHEVLLL